MFIVNQEFFAIQEVLKMIGKMYHCQQLFPGKTVTSLTFS